MAQVINTNIASLNAQRNLSTSQTALATSLQRLSSGLRINSAKDDAAGMAISDRMTSQIRGLNQAARNANDGISLAQTAEGSLNAISDNLQRLRELAVQSANASNSQSDRTTMQNEVTQLVSEMQRVASGAEFNSVKLLDGSFNAQTFQVGANNTANDQITVTSMADSRTAALGGTSYSATATSTLAGNGTAFVATDLVINGFAVGASTAAQDTKSFSGNAGSAIAKAAAINATGSGVTATANANTQAGVLATAFVATTNDIAAGALTINGVSVGAVTGAGTAAAQGTAIAAAIQAVSASSGVFATSSVAGVVTLTAADGRNIVVNQTGTASVANTGLTTGTTSSKITLTSSASTGFTLVDGGSTFGGANLGIAMGTTGATSSFTSIANITVASAAGALTALNSIDAALASVNNSRAALGAYQNRFASAVSNLATSAENLTASRSRIQDTDFAAETAAMTRGQILQQAGTAILAQANSLPNSVLSLLK